MNTRLYALIAIIVCITAIWLLNRLNDKGTLKSNAVFRYTASFFVGDFGLFSFPLSLWSISSTNPAGTFRS